MSVLEVGFPSADFPGPTPFSLRIPLAWRGFAVPDAQLAVGAADPVARFRPNVVVNTHRIRRTASPELDVEMLVAGDDSLPGVEVVADDVDPGPPLARRRRLRHDGPENVPLLAIRLLVLVPVGDQLGDVVSVVGTAAYDSPPAVHRELEAVVDSLTVATRSSD
ncbi:MAG: hypothetical protein ACK5OX_05980 [Desertimonas sp.]